MFRSVFLLTICFSYLTFSVNAQHELRVQRFLEQQMKMNPLADPGDIQDWHIQDQYTDPMTRLTYVYVQHQVQGISLLNAISVLAIRDNEVIYGHAGFISQVNQKIRNRTIVLTPEQAIYHALEHKNLEKEPLESYDMTAQGWIEYPAMSYMSSSIRVRPLYVEVEQAWVLTWEVSFELSYEPHWWNIRIDAMDGRFIDEQDYTLSCHFDGYASEPELPFSPEPQPNPGPLNTSIPSYRVFPLPVEAPSFGPRALLTNPSILSASPFGWHDVDGIIGADYTITRGNHVFAYEDQNNDNLPGFSPDGGTNMVFDFPFTNGNVNPSLNLSAGITNLFYVNGAIHDYLYALGFTEAAGNFQENNYGAAGYANDAVKAEAMDGSGFNNANFSTPPDGSSGRMQMYLWSGNTTPCTSLSISSGTLNGLLTVGTASFAPHATVTADVVLVNDGVAPFTDACTPIVNAIAGKIALIDRGGTCTFSGKMQMAKNAGAIGVIIANNVSGSPISMTGTPPNPIPTVMISQADGNLLKAALLSGPVNATLTTCTVHPVDASFDNGVIVHEYGHGVSNRLTGGPSNVSCLNNAEQGGEGWSDWLALMMTIEPGDQGANARTIGTYSKDQPTTGSGVRRYPYSTSLSVNPLTYANLGTSTTVHQRGEILCCALWDLSWKLISTHGFNANPAISSAGNQIAMRLILEGLKLQPCSPGFLDARNAILTADALLYNYAYRCAIWEAFAGRGMGYDAVQGSSNIVGDEVAGYLMPPYCLPPTQVPSAAFTASTYTLTCGQTVQYTDQSIQAFQWFWNFGDGNSSILQHPSHTYTSPGTYTVKLVVSNPLGTDSVLQTITVSPAFTVSSSVSPTQLCAGQNVLLQATASGSASRSYAVSSIPFTPDSISGSVVTLADDQVSGALPIGFNFEFFGQSFSQFYICSNGFITFSPGSPSSPVYGLPIPGVTAPNHLIALAWNDLNPSIAGSSIRYATLGIAPNRRLVVQYQAPHFLSASLPFQVQAILREGSNLIDIHTTMISNASSFDNSATTTQGVENIDGTVGVSVPGRNSALFSASLDAYRFTPIVPYSFIWNPGNLNGSLQQLPVNQTTTYTLSVSDGTACQLQLPQPAVQVIPCSVTLNIRALIEGFYAGAGQMYPVLMQSGIGSNNSLCDSITLELRAATAPYATQYSLKTVMQTNGWLSANFNVTAGAYYVVLRHRNGLMTWSAQPQSLVSGVVNYDFTTAMSQAYGNNLVSLDANHWGIFSGDVLADENIDLIDLQLVENSIASFGFGYLPTDINGDGNVDLLDMPVLEDNINQFVFSNHP